MSHFRVLNEETGFVAYEGTSLAQIRGFLDGRTQDGFFRSRIVVDVDIRGDHLHGYQIVVVDDRTGQILAAGPEVGIEALEDTIFNARLAIMPAAVVKALGGWERPPGEMKPDDDSEWWGDDDTGDDWKHGVQP